MARKTYNLPDDLADWLDEIADLNGRSASAMLTLFLLEIKHRTQNK